MSRTDISAASFADYLRRMCGDGSMEWCYEPAQTSVLLDIADILDENAKLRELVRDMWREGAFEPGANYVTEAYGLAERTRELGIEVR